MELEERKRYLSRLLIDVQRVRSSLLEALGNDEAAVTVLTDLEPWLFGKGCIVLPLQRCIDGAPDDGDVLNFSIIARRSPNLVASAVLSKRKDPTSEEVFGGGKDF